MKTTFRIMQTLRAPFRGLGVLSFLFFISCSTFEQNEEKMALTLTIPGGTVQLSGNPIKISTTASAVSGATNHKMLLRVVSTDGEIANGPWIDDIEGYSADFFIEGLVDAKFNTEFDIDFTDVVVPHEGGIAEITVEVGESYVSSTGVYTVVWKGTPTAMKIIKGNLTKEELAALVSYGYSFYVAFITDYNFLTNRFTFQTTRQQFWVSDISHHVKAWVYRLSSETLSFGCSVDFTDGSFDGDSFYMEDVPGNSLYEVNVSVIAQTIAALHPGKTVAKYYIYFPVQGGNHGCEVTVTNKYSEVHEEILVKNRFGAVEIIHCYGSFQQNHDTKKITFTTHADPDPFVPTIISESAGNQYKYKINTGFKTEHERKWIADLLGSNQAWWKSERLLPIGGNTFGMVPINIVPGSFRVVDTQEDLMSMEFEFEIAHID